MFINNKYSSIYYKIVEKAKARALIKHKERHHITPKSFYQAHNKSGWISGDPDCADNLVNLTPREHYICHLLLTKFTVGLANKKMWFALKRLTNRKDSYPIKSSRIYEYIRKNHSETVSNLFKGVKKNYNHWGGKKHTAKSKEKQSLVKQGINNPMYGRTQSADTVKRITDAQKNIPKPKFVCEKCNKIVGGKSNLIRWHGNNCKEIQNY